MCVRDGLGERRGVCVLTVEMSAPLPAGGASRIVALITSSGSPSSRRATLTV